MSAQPGKVETYCQAWISSLALLLSRMAPGDWQVETVDVPGDFAPVASLRVTAGGSLAGQQWLGLAAVDINGLLGILLGEEITVTGELDQTQREAVEELIRQWAGLAASALKPDFGEVSLQVALDSAGHIPSGVTKLLRVIGDRRSIAVVFELERALVETLRQTAAGAELDSETVEDEGAGPTRPAVLPPPGSDRIEELLRQGNLELLMDVELAVMLRFGSRQASLHEVLDLATGAVLELDREIQEPVDLVLNDKVIARGEVVVVDGNYGLRVLEVASAQQRVASL